MQIEPETIRAVEKLAGGLPAGDADMGNLVQLAVLVANADGVIDESEMVALRELLESVLGSRVRTDFVKHFVRSAIEEVRRGGLDGSGRRVGQWLARLDVVDDGISAALAIAYASNGFSRVERAVIETIARGAGITAERVDSLAAAFRRADA